MKKILLIIPAYNEEGNIKKVVNDIALFKDSGLLVNVSVDYVVINDCSTDNTSKLLKEHKICHIDLIRNLGIGGAVQTGIIYALNNDYDACVQFDGDGQHDIFSLKNIVAPIFNLEADFVVGSRFISNNHTFQSTFLRRCGIQLLSLFLKLFTNLRVKDITSGYRGMNRKVMKLFKDNYPKKYPEPESYMLLHKNNFKVMEVEANMFERECGESSINIINSVSYIVEVAIAMFVQTFIKKERRIYE